MTFSVRFSALAQRQIDDFADYLRAYSEDFVVEQRDRLDRIFSTNLTESPLNLGLLPAHRGAVPRLPLSRRPPHPVRQESVCWPPESAFASCGHRDVRSFAALWQYRPFIATQQIASLSS